MTSFISVRFSGRVNLKQFEKKTALEGTQDALAENFLNLTWCNGLFSAF